MANTETMLAADALAVDVWRLIRLPVDADLVECLRPHLMPPMGRGLVTTAGLHALLRTNAGPIVRKTMQTIERDRRTKCVRALPVQWELSRLDKRYLLEGSYLGCSGAPTPDDGLVHPTHPRARDFEVLRDG